MEKVKKTSSSHELPQSSVVKREERQQTLSFLYKHPYSIIIFYRILE